MQPPVWDLRLLRDPSTTECTYGPARTADQEGVLVESWTASYRSYEAVDGELRPIRIRGYMARPASGAGRRLPGIVLSHGLGGQAEESGVQTLAAQTGALVLGYTGPGGGSEPENTSEGLPAGHDSGKRMFDTIPDLRGTWFWGHAVAAIRGLNCLATHPGVDATRLGMTGFSAGGVATLLVAGVDDRLKAAVPLSGTLAWSEATRSPNAWQHALLARAGYTIDSPEWIRLQRELIDPAAAMARARANVLMINGSTDEFFPLSAHVATYDAIPSTKRTAIAANFDHGCYSLTGGEPAGAIEARRDVRLMSRRMWFHHWFGTDPRFAYLPAEPTATVTNTGGGTLLAAAVDPGGPNLEIERVDFYFSTDDAFLFAYVQLDRFSSASYGKLVGVPAPANLVYYVDVTYRTKDPLFPRRFVLSSRPSLPAGHVPRIRGLPDSGTPCQ